MGNGFARLPLIPRFVLADAALPADLLDDPPGPVEDGIVRADVVINDGLIERVAPAESESDFPNLDLDGGMVWPCFVDMHTHIDKGHIWPRRPNPDGTFPSALAAVQADREANWSAADVARRMDFSLRCAHAHGTALLRTHLDSVPPQYSVSWPVFAEMRERWKDRIVLQAASLFPVDLFLDEAFAADIVATVARHGGVLGAVTYMVPDLDRAIELMMHSAESAGLDLDFHVDETADPAATSLRHIADAAIRTAFQGEIVVGHCCSLAMQSEAEAEATMERVAEAEIAVVSLPMCNQFLQDRAAGTTPRWRGVTLIQEMAARDIPVAVASDNTRDPFFAYGDLDMVEVFREAVRILHLDYPVGDWADMVTSSPADIIGHPERGVIRAGEPADLVLFRARNWTELLARPQADRTVLRSGKAIDTTLPDYRELDDLMRMA